MTWPEAFALVGGLFVIFGFLAIISLSDGTRGPSVRPPSLEQLRNHQMEGLRALIDRDGNS